MKKCTCTNQQEADNCRTDCDNTFGAIENLNNVKAAAPLLYEFVEKVAAMHPDGNPSHLIKDARYILERIKITTTP